MLLCFFFFLKPPPLLSSSLSLSLCQSHRDRQHCSKVIQPSLRSAAPHLALGRDLSPLMIGKDTDKFNEYRLVNSGTAMPAGDKQQAIAAKKVALRELPNETQNTFMKPPGNSPLPKNRGPISDVAKVSGIKRQQPSCPSSPARPTPLGNTGSNGHLVYVRRKLETEAGKIAASDNVDSADSPSSRKNSIDGTRGAKVLQEPAQETKVSPSAFAPAPVPLTRLKTSSGEPSLVLSLEKPTESSEPEPSHSTGTNGIAVQPRPQRPSDQHWKERFLRLQAFLKNCDQSNQEEYIQKLRSLSAVDRSRHAVELEKKAIQLLLEEAKELQRMKVMDVLGKASPTNQSSVSTQNLSPMQTVRGK